MDKSYMRWVEFFTGEGNQLSMMRLMVFFSFWPASYIAVSIRNTESLAVYLGAYVTGYVGGKSIDAVGKRKSNVVSIKSPSNKE